MIEVTPGLSIETIEHLDFAIPCTYGDPGGCRGSNSAVWLVVKIPLCPHDDDHYTCEPCWQYRNSRGFVVCYECRARCHALADVARLEPVNQGRLR